ncbi:MAG: TfoX/Sxy family protein [Acidobacteriota bacterium]
MAFDETLARRVRAALAGRTDLVEKHMFGGVCFMVRGHMCCGIVGSSLMVRLGAAEADRLADEPHVRPMDFTGTPMRGFLYVDAEGLATPKALGRWVDRSVAFAESQPRKAVKSEHSRAARSPRRRTARR